MCGQDGEGLSFLFWVCHDAGLAVADDTGVVGCPSAWHSGVDEFVVDVDFEADERVYLDHVEFTSDVGAMEVKYVVLVPEVHGDDVGCVVGGHGEATDPCLGEDRLEFMMVCDCFFIAAHWVCGV